MKCKLLFLVGLFVWFEGVGQIGFEDHVVIDNPYSMDGAISVINVDIDGDGDMDLLAGAANDGNVVWYENINGQGDFGTQKVISSEAYGVTMLQVSDLDNDGDIDVLSASSSGSENKVVWYENINGQGDFSSEKTIATSLSSEARAVYAADFDDDGDHDIVTAFDGASSGVQNKIVWHKNNGQGGFTATQTISNESDVKSFNSFDIDEDGDIDIIAGIYDFGTKIVFYENMDGLGDFSSEQIVINVQGTIRTMNVSDLNSDGNLDIVLPIYFDDKIIWFENMGAGIYSAEKTINTLTDGAYSTYSVDIDDDGDLDVLSASENDNKIAWYENTDGLGNFGSQQIISTEVVLPKSVYAADIDNDGDVDVFSASFSDDKLAWYENMDGQGAFGTQQEITTPTANGVESIYPTDIDGDGDLDLISASILDTKIAWYENTDGQGNFDIQHVITIDILFLKFIIASDLDNDGDMDILFASSNDDKVGWFENIDGQGNFGAEKIITTNANVVYSISVADIDNDGDNDVLSASRTDDKIAWYENTDGQGNFSAQQIISSTVDDARSVYTGDIDGDGDMDVLAAIGSLFSGEIVWYENIDGMGNFGTPQVLLQEFDGANSVYTADIDFDGDKDVIAAAKWGDQLVWIENIDGQGSFGIPQNVTLDANGVNTVYASDIDSDGDMDIISCSSADDKITWHKNLGVVTNEIIGKIILDINSNGCNIDDPIVSDMMIFTSSSSQNLATFSLSNGFYQFFPNEGDFTTLITPPTYYSVNPISHISNFIGIGNIDTANFCITPTQTINDLNITLLPLSEARPGFDATYQLVYHNIGTTQLSGTVSLEFNDTKLNFLNASEPLASKNNNTLIFDYINLNPFETRTIDITFNVQPPPIVNIDDLLTFTATINPISGDFTEDDNTFTFDQTVIGSYDPNDIRVLEGEEVLIENADQYLHYIIRFQNTGTADAINVRVENMLDDKLDWNTMQLESYSHPNRVEIKDGNEVSFIFDGIYLPDSTTNEPASHGFIAYKIKPKSDVQIGDIISNTADIFFDFNEAIVTNTVMTKIVDPVSIKENTQLRFSIFPIPTSGILTIQSKTAIAQIEIYDQLGQLVLTKLNGNQIDISNLNQGFYFCKVSNENGDAGIKKVIKE